MKAPLEHIAPKVAVVTTSTFFTISFGESSLLIAETSSAVSTTALPFLIFSLISSYDFFVVIFWFFYNETQLSRTAMQNSFNFGFGKCIHAQSAHTAVGEVHLAKPVEQ
jgi:hypothetical protein